MFLTPVSSHEIKNILNVLHDFAPGHDEIRLGPLKSIVPYIEVSLTYICNLSVNQRIFPDILKIVIPLCKKIIEQYHHRRKTRYNSNTKLVSVNHILLILH